MKIIHCADIHLDSKMTSNLDGEKAKERKYEILSTFLEMISYAKTEEIKHIIIAGDLFDTNTFSAATRNSVKDAIISNNEINYYFIKGNHGGGDRFLESFDEIPENLHLFGEEWKSYTLNDDNFKIKIFGIELNDSNIGTVYSSLMLDPRDINIVTMHGQINEYQNSKKAEIISLNDLRNKNINYLALGHVHEYQKGELPPRGQYCYCGCLEGRGFDECGKHGFVVIDVNESEQTCSSEFIPFAKRNLYEISVDISDCVSTPDIKEKIKNAIESQKCKEKDLVKIVLIGEISLDCEKNTEHLTKYLMEQFYYAKIKDKTKIAVDYNDFELDASLKGEFVRLIKTQEELSEEEKAEIIKCGFQVLNGEEIEL